MRTVYIDTESTGLDARIHQVCEIAWAVDGLPIQSIVPPHGLTHADPKALEVNRYFERGLHLRVPTEAEWANAHASLCADLTGAQLVAANPAFDAAMLTQVLGYAPWHYRLRDVEERAAAIFGWELSRGLNAVAAELRGRGYVVPAPDHSAEADVRTLRVCWNALDVERSALAAA